MGKQIRKDFPGEPILLLGVLKGAVPFLADLARQIPGEVTFDFIAVSSYGKASHSSGQVKLNKDLDSSIEGKTVLVVEDILDTGLTLQYLLRISAAAKAEAFADCRAAGQSGAGELRTCMRTMWGFRFRMSLWLDLGWILRSATGICRTSGFCNSLLRITQHWQTGALGRLL